MRLRTTLPLGTLLLALVGCAAQQDPVAVPVTSTQTRSAPAWIDSEVVPGGLAAVGIAQPNPMGDKGFQRTVALADARTKLAGKVKVRVQNLFSQLNQQTTSASAGASPVKADVMNRVIENVTRQLINQDLQGASTRATWTDPADGSLYLLLVMTGESADRALASAAKTQIRQEVARGNKSLEPALPKVDAAVAANPSESEESLNAALDRLDPTAPGNPVP